MSSPEHPTPKASSSGNSDPVVSTRNGNTTTGGSQKQGQRPVAVPVVQLTKQTKRIQPDLTAVMKKVQNTEKEFQAREKKLEQQKMFLELHQKQQEQKMQEWRTEKEFKLRQKLEQLQFDNIAFNKCMEWKREALRKERDDLAEMEDLGEGIIDRQEPVTLEVGGEKFRTELSTLTKHQSSIFPSLVKALERREAAKERDSDADQNSNRSRKGPNIFIDRDGKHFRFILNYLRQGKQVMQGTALRNADKYVLREMLYEVCYYKLAELEQLLESRLQTLLTGMH